MGNALKNEKQAATTRGSRGASANGQSTKLRQRLRLDLTDPLASDAELRGHFSSVRGWPSSRSNARSQRACLVWSMSVPGVVPELTG
jgi:hypothetical protein